MIQASPITKCTCALINHLGRARNSGTSIIILRACRKATCALRTQRRQSSQVSTCFPLKSQRSYMLVRLVYVSCWLVLLQQPQSLRKPLQCCSVDYDWRHYPTAGSIGVLIKSCVGIVQKQVAVGVWGYRLLLADKLESGKTRGSWCMVSKQRSSIFVVATLPPKRQYPGVPSTPATSHRPKVSMHRRDGCTARGRFVVVCRQRAERLNCRLACQTIF